MNGDPSRAVCESVADASPADSTPDATSPLLLRRFVSEP